MSPLYALSSAGANEFVEVFHEWEAGVSLRWTGNTTSSFSSPLLILKY